MTDRRVVYSSSSRKRGLTLYILYTRANRASAPSKFDNGGGGDIYVIELLLQRAKMFIEGLISRVLYSGREGGGG